MSTAALCGTSVGLSFGLHGGWAVVLAALIVLLSRLAALESRSASRARSAGAMLAVFVFFLYSAGHAGLSAAVGTPYLPGTLLFLICFAAVQAMVAGVSAYVTFRVPMSSANRLLLILPALWLLREWTTSRIDLAAPWLTIGAAQAPDGPLAPLFPLGGVFLVSGVTLVASGAIALAIRRKAPKPVVIVGLTTALLALAASGRTVWTDPSNSATVEVVQSGASPDGDATAAATGRTLKTYADVIASSHATLIVTPQFAIAKVPDALPPGYLAQLGAELQAKNADALLGIYLPGSRTNEYYNGVASIGASSEQYYRKQHLFPFGEYMPLPPRVVDWINSTFDHPRTDVVRGPLVADALFAGGLRVAIAICYEIAFGDTLRLQAASADAIVDMSTDGTHDSTQIDAQTKQIAQARVLEFQKPLIRTSDVRGTFFMDSTARITDELPPFLQGTMTRTVQGRTGLTPYARRGDGLALGMAGFAIAFGLLIAVAPRVRPMRRRTSVNMALHASRPSAGMPGQVGQALPAALALLVIVAGLFYFMVNTGQTVTEKIRVTNAADAAAYSAAVVEARALNYDAYLNRAMLANEMAIAQMVSFASWIDYFATAADRFSAYVTDMNRYLLPNPKVAVLDVAFGGSAAVAAYFGGSTVHKYADNLVDYGASAIVTLHDIVTFLLSASQVAVQGSLTGGIRQGQIADQVVKAMDPKLNAEVVVVSHGFDLFTKEYSGKDRKRFADVATRSRGLFTRERNFTLSSYDIPLVRKNGALKKRGGTDLVGLDEWRGVDTLELHGQKFTCTRKLRLVWCDDVRTPIAWGAVDVNAGGGDAGHGYHGNAYGENSRTARKADSYMHEPKYALFHGLPSSREIAKTDPATDESTAITILVTKSQSDTVTSGNAATVKPAGALAVFNDHPAGGKIASLGRAQVYFDRIAARADGKTELGSLYNPYWRVRLVAPTVADRAYAATKQGGLLMPSIQ